MVKVKHQEVTTLFMESKMCKEKTHGMLLVAFTENQLPLRLLLIPISEDPPSQVAGTQFAELKTPTDPLVYQQSVTTFH